MLRSLTHYWRLNLAVLGGAAVATAVLTGALLVGDSVRGSLRALTLDRLGSVDAALVAERFFGADLETRLREHPRFAEGFGAAAPAVVVRGSAVRADTGARASRVGIYGVDQQFFSMFEGPAPDFSRRGGQIFPSVVINEVLATELGASVGDSLLLRFGQSSDVPRDTLMGEKDVSDVVASQRVAVAAVVPASGYGRFGLAPSQQRPANAFLELGQLQRALDRPGRINAILLGGRQPGGDAQRLLDEVLTLEDLGLGLRDGTGFFAVESDEFVLRPHVEEAVLRSAAAARARSMPIQSYLANSMRLGDRELPYSMVAALDPLGDGVWSSLQLLDGGTAPALAAGEILLGAWAAEDLGASAGDVVSMDYFVVGPREELTVATRRFDVAGVVAMRDLAADAALTPDYPGIQDADDMTAWDPPFPVRLDRIRPEDEAFWDKYRATPKAFVSRAAGRELWSTRYGSTTSVRIAATPGEDLAATREAFEEALLAALPAGAAGLAMRDVKSEGLEAGVGAISFSLYFFYFSFFLIVSAALVVGLLFRLGVEHRAREIGLRLAVGFPVPAVRRGLLAEGGILAASGAGLGLLLAVAYGALLMLALTTIWLPAVGSSELSLHVTPLSLGLGWAAAVLVVLFSIAAALRRLRRIPPSALLAGSTSTPARRGGGRLARVLAWGGLAAAAGLAGTAVVTGSLDNAGLTFGSGGALLVSGLAWFSLWCRRPARRDAGALASTPLLGIAARNSAWNPGRSILSVALIGVACYVVVVTGAYRHRFGDELQERDSGAGGFALVAETDVPVHQDLNRPEDREALGFQPDDADKLASTTVYPLRVLPGDDASCLNLYQPRRPKILGVPDDLLERGGFRFKTLVGAEETTDPWRALEQPLGEGVIPAFGDAHSMKYILHLEPGQDLVLQDEYGRDVRLRLVGVLDRSIFQSELLIAESALLRHFPSRTGFSYFLVETPFEGAREVGQALERGLEPFGFDSTTTWDRLAAFQSVEHTYLSTFQALGGLGLLLGTVGLGVVLLRNVTERRGELATMRAFGFRRARLGWMVAAETAFLLLVGMAVGTAAALVSAAPSLAGAPLSWVSIAGTLALVSLFGMVSCLVAVRFALRVPLLTALKAER